MILGTSEVQAVRSLSKRGRLYLSTPPCKQVDPCMLETFLLKPVSQTSDNLSFRGFTYPVLEVSGSKINVLNPAYTVSDSTRNLIGFR